MRKDDNDGHGHGTAIQVGFLLASVPEPGIRHRTEIIRMLAHSGAPAPDLDGWAYARTVGHGHVVG